MTKAIILLSGGLDSTVVLALAIAEGKTCHAVSFDYGQKHAIELESAKKIAEHYKVPHTVIRIDSSIFGLSSLVSELAVPQSRTLEQINTTGTPSTYVPARNTLFLTYALALCEVHDAQEIHYGPNRLDATGYSDCRPAYVEAFQLLINLATKQSVEGHPPRLVTPLIMWDKKQIIEQGMRLKAPLDMTWSCYNPVKSHPCEVCDACILRADGFANMPRSILEDQRRDAEKQNKQDGRIDLRSA